MKTAFLNTGVTSVIRRYFSAMFAMRPIEQRFSGHRLGGSPFSVAIDRL
jgi:hypothetical protein